MSAKPDYQEVVKLLVENLRQDKPLLEGAVLFRGSRFGDDQPGSSTPDQLHAHLLPQLAAGYTHNWGNKEAFIDTYPINRDTTRFYTSHSLDEHLKGKPVTSYSVQDVERAIRPLVENIACLPPGPGRERNIANLERFIKSSFYEAGVPLKSLARGDGPPREKFYYSGEPTAKKDNDIFNRMERVTPANETRAKVAYAINRKSRVTASIENLEVLHPVAAKAFQTLRGAVQRDHAVSVLEKHGSKPWADFTQAALAEPVSEKHSHVLRLANGLAASLESSDRTVRARALLVTQQLGALDPRTVTLKDVGQVIVGVNRTFQRESLSGNAAGRAETGTMASAKPAAPSLGRSMER